MRTYLLIIALLTSNLIFSQKFLDPPKLDIEDLKLTSYTKNPSEAAEVIYKSYHYYITDGDLHLDVISRVKIYKKDDAKKFLEEEIYTYLGKNHNEEKVTSLKVNTYNLENGKIATTTVNKNSKYQSKENKNYSVTKFAFENVKDGSVVEYKYSVLSPFLYVIPRVMVEDEVPIRYFEYVFDAPKHFGYNINYKGTLMPKNRDVSERVLYGTDCRTYRFAYNDLAAYRNEKYVNNIDNYRTSIRAELNSTDFPITSNGAYSTGISGGFKSYGISWSDIRKQLYDDENFGDELKRNNLVKNLLPEDIKSIKNDKDRAAAVLKFTQNKYKWNGEYSAFTDKGIKQLIATNSGNSAEINLMLILLMRSANLNAEPVLLSTIGRGLLTAYSPSISMLNYVLAIVDFDGKPILYDATSKMTTPNIIRPAALNYYGYVMTKDEAKPIDVVCPEKSVTYLTVDAKLNPDGTFTGDFSDRDTMLYAMMNSESYDKDKDAYQKESYKERYKFPYANIKSGATENGDFETSFAFDSVDSFADGIGGKLVFNPLLFLYRKSHEFDQAEERRSPIELMTGYDRVKKVTITLPDGYAFENVPKSKKFRTEDSAIQYVYKVTQEGNKLTVETTTTVEDPVYPKGYYPAFKQIFDNITKLEGQVVTVVKK